MKNFRVTDKDLYEFNAWIKGRLQDTPRLMQYFDKEKDYEEYMIDYQDSHLNLDNDPAVIDKNYAITNDQYMKEAIRLIKIRDKKISDEEAKELADFGLGLAFKPQDFIDVLKDTLKKEGKRFSETEGVKCDWPDGVYQVSYDDFMVINSIDNQMKLTYETEEFGDEEFNGTLTVKDGIAKLVKNAVQSYSEREKVSAEMLEKAKNEGVVQKKPNGAWGIISIEAGEWWIPDYDSKENAENALKAYHANKGFSSESPDWLVAYLRPYNTDPNSSDGGLLRVIKLDTGVSAIHAGDIISDYLVVGILGTYKHKESALNYLDRIDLEKDFPKTKGIKKDHRILTKSFTDKGFSDKMQEITFRTTNPELLTKIVKAIGQHGNPGHSFDIVIDKGDEKEEVFGWDGDGSDRIDLDNIEPTRKFSFSDGTLDVGEMIGQIMRSISSMHLWHLITNSYAEHKALEDYYTEMPDLIDKFAEDFISNTTEKLEYARFFNTISWIDPTEGPIKYLEQLLSDIANTRAHVAFSDAEKSDLDAVCSLIEGTLYKLKRLDNPRNFILK